MRERLSTNYKALKINLDPNFYGTFAEIGAGQEVVRHFFKTGGASGTIAKAMSAYDMKFSDAIYGEEPDGRYVSRSRLLKMLDHETNLLTERLHGDRYEGKKYFAFANTVTTINYAKTNEAHGWLGMRFQTKESGPFHDVIMHVKLLDSDSSIQQSVLGDLGVNLIYACHTYWQNPNQFVDSLIDNLPMKSIEIDMLSFSGEDFQQIDSRLVSLILVTKGFSKVACFLPDGAVIQPKDLLYKKNICILRARFKPFTNLNQDMLTNGINLFMKDYKLSPESVTNICEISLNNLTTNDQNVNLQDFLDRAEIICKIGYPVLITNFAEHYELTKFLKSCKPQKIGILLGVMNLIQIFDKLKYTNPISELLLQFGYLFSQDVKIYAYPFRPRKSEQILKSRDIIVDSEIQPLFELIQKNHLISDYESYEQENLQIDSSKLVAEIQSNQPNWENFVPSMVAEIIKEKCLFDYPCDIEKKRKKTAENLFYAAHG